MSVKLEKAIELSELDKLPHANLQEIREEIAAQRKASMAQIPSRKCEVWSCAMSRGKMEPTSLKLEATGQNMWVCKRCGRVRFYRD